MTEQNKPKPPSAEELINGRLQPSDSAALIAASAIVAALDRLTAAVAAQMPRCEECPDVSPDGSVGYCRLHRGHQGPCQPGRW